MEVPILPWTLLIPQRNKKKLFIETKIISEPLKQHEEPKSETHERKRRQNKVTKPDPAFGTPSKDCHSKCWAGVL